MQSIQVTGSHIYKYIYYKCVAIYLEASNVLTYIYITPLIGDLHM